MQGMLEDFSSYACTSVRPDLTSVCAHLDPSLSTFCLLGLVRIGLIAHNNIGPVSEFSGSSCKSSSSSGYELFA